jgi:predicted permease
VVDNSVAAVAEWFMSVGWPLPIESDHSTAQQHHSLNIAGPVHPSAVRSVMAHLVADLRQAVRMAARQPAFTSLIVLTLGLGIGANTAIFSAVHGLLLRAAPFHEPDRLVRITTVRGDEEGPVAVPEFDDLQELQIFEAAAMYTDQGKYNASGFGTPEELPATITNHNLFRVLGVEPFIGSTFPATFDRSRAFGVVISYGLWERKFGRDPNIVGRSMTLDGAPGYTIYGVMPHAFTFPSNSDLFRSSGISPVPAYYQRRDVRSMYVVARLRPGLSVDQARSAIGGLASRLAREQPSTNGGLTFKVTPISEMYTGTIRPYVLLLFGAVALVLLIACANVANLLLSRAIARDREVSVRTARGAGRWRIVRQLLTESLFLSALGALFGLAVATLGVRTLGGLVPVVLPPWMRIEVDAQVLVFMAMVTAIAGVAAGLVPAWRSGATDLQSALKDGARGSSAGVRQQRLRGTLVVAEVALALVLLVGAALLLQTVIRLHQVPLGFDRANALTFQVELGWAAYGTLEKTSTFHDRVLERLSALPGVQAVTFDNNLPMSGKAHDAQPVRLYGQSPDDEARNPYVNQHLVGPEYFRVMGIRLESGRAFTHDDRAGTRPVAVISRRLAERLWPHQNPIGQQFQFADTASPEIWTTVVGVSASVLHQSLDGDPGLDVYRPYTQISTAGPWYVIRTGGDPAVLTHAATSVIEAIDPNQSFLDVLSYEQRIANSMWQRRLAGWLLGAFAMLALLLAAVGLYGVLSQLVAQRTRDLGVRIALGASPGDILRLVLQQGLQLAALGAVIGVVAAAIAASGIASVLYGVSPHDPLTMTAVTVLLLGIAALACYVPARRAMRVDPIVALRAE